MRRRYCLGCWPRQCLLPLVVGLPLGKVPAEGQVLRAQKVSASSRWSSAGRREGEGRPLRWSAVGSSGGRPLALLRGLRTLHRGAGRPPRRGRPTPPTGPETPKWSKYYTLYTRARARKKEKRRGPDPRSLSFGPLNGPL